MLRVYERPTSYNDRVATLASSVILPVCLLAHCFAGMYVSMVTLVLTANAHHSCLVLLLRFAQATLRYFYSVVVECPAQLFAPPPRTNSSQLHHYHFNILNCSFCQASYNSMATLFIMGSAASVVLIALPFLFRAQTVTYSMELERQPPFDCVQGIQDYSCPGVEPLRPMQRNSSPTDAGRSRARHDQGRRLAVRTRHSLCVVCMRVLVAVVGLLC